MSASLEFLLGLLEQDEPPYVASEDLDGEHGPALRTWQALGFLSDEPAINPRASCPHCDGGVPYRLDERYVCAICRSVVDGKHFFLYQVDHDAFLQWLAAQLNLRGGVRRIEERLWQLGTWEADGEVLECFYRNGGVLAEVGRMRLSAYRRTLVFYGLSVPPKTERFAGPCVSLLELLKLKESLAVTDLRPLLRVRGNVRFDDQSGVLWVGDESVGEVPVGSKEFYFLDCLTRHRDCFVSYADLKSEILRRSGNRDTRDEANFCQRCKSRIKRHFMPQIDRLLVTTNRAEGYRLRAFVEL